MICAEHDLWKRAREFLHGSVQSGALLRNLLMEEIVEHYETFKLMSQFEVPAE